MSTEFKSLNRTAEENYELMTFAQGLTLNFNTNFNFVRMSGDNVIIFDKKLFRFRIISPNGRIIPYNTKPIQNRIYTLTV